MHDSVSIYGLATDAAPDADAQLPTRRCTRRNLTACALATILTCVATFLLLAIYGEDTTSDQCSGTQEARLLQCAEDCTNCDMASTKSFLGACTTGYGEEARIALDDACAPPTDEDFLAAGDRTRRLQADIDEYWEVLSYGFNVDPEMPSFLKETTQLFQLSRGDVSVVSRTIADGDTVYSTSDDSRGHQLNAGLHMSGGRGPFELAASMEVSQSSDRDIKTSRLDVTQSFNKFTTVSKGGLRVLPHTRLDPSFTSFIHSTPIEDVEQISSTLGIFFARTSKLGGLVRKSYAMQVTQEDTEASLTTELKGAYKGFFGHADASASFGVSRSTRENGAEIKTTFHAHGGQTSLWLQPMRPEHYLEDFSRIQGEWAASFDTSNLYPYDLELRPIWELVRRVDEAKGDALRTQLEGKWAREEGAFSPTKFYTPAKPARCSAVDCTALKRCPRPQSTDYTIIEWLNGCYDAECCKVQFLDNTEGNKVRCSLANSLRSYLEKVDEPMQCNVCCSTYHPASGSPFIRERHPEGSDLKCPGDTHCQYRFTCHHNTYCGSTCDGSC